MIRINERIATVALGVLCAQAVGRAQPPPPPAASPRVAILATRPDGEETSLILQPVDSPQPAAPSALIRHLPGAIVRGAVVPQASAVVVIADTIEKTDPSWRASLMLVSTERKDPVSLVENVYAGTRPLVLPDGRVFVLSGTEGPEPSDAEAAEGRLRVDSLEIYEVNLEKSEKKVVYRSQGYIAFLAGSFAGEIIIYEVGPDQAQIIAVDVSRPDYPVRDLWRPVLPNARDFSIDVQGHSLLFTNTDEANPAESVAQRIDLNKPTRPQPRPPKGAIVKPSNLVLLDRSKLHEVRAFAWPDRTVAVSKELGKLAVKNALGAAVRTPPRMPTGINVIRDFYKVDQQTWAVVLNRQRVGSLQQVLAIRAGQGRDEGESRPVAAPTGVQLDVAGVLLPGPAEIDRAPPILKEPPIRKPVNWLPKDLKLRILPGLRRVP